MYHRKCVLLMLTKSLKAWKKTAETESSLGQMKNAMKPSSTVSSVTRYFFLSELDVAVFSVFSLESPNSHKVVTGTRLGFFSIGPPLPLSASSVYIWHVLCSLLLNMAVLLFSSNVHKVVTLIRFGAL